MTREIRQLRRDPATIASMERIGIVSFGEHYRGGLLRRTWESSDGRSIFLGAFECERLISFMGFFAHEAFAGDEPRLVYQVVQAATDPEFRGQGLFQTIYNHAMESLQGDYMIAFPAETSRAQTSFPIFTGRLGFKIVPQVRLWLPCRAASPLLNPAAVRSAREEKKLCRIEQRHAAERKKRESPGTIVEHDQHGNFIWGRVRTRKLGPVALSFLDAGGCDPANPRWLGATLTGLREALGVEAVRFICTEDASLAAGTRWTLPLRARPLIWAPLGPALPSPRFDAFNGMADYW